MKTDLDALDTHELPLVVPSMSRASRRAQALSEVLEREHRPLLRFLTKRTKSVDEAEDITQEACARVLAAKQNDPIKSLAGYLWRIALNILTDRRRHLKIQNRYLQIARTQEQSFAASAEDEADARIQLDLLSEAIRELPPKCLQAFILRVLQGLAFEDVAAEMKMSERMAKIYVARALSHLQHSIDEAANRENSL